MGPKLRIDSEIDAAMRAIVPLNPGQWLISRKAISSGMSNFRYLSRLAFIARQISCLMII